MTIPVEKPKITDKTPSSAYKRHFISKENVMNKSTISNPIDTIERYITSKTKKIKNHKIGKIILAIPPTVDNICEKIAQKIGKFMNTGIGKIILFVTLFGPITLIPLIYQAFFNQNIDILRVSTWGWMLIFDISAFLGLCIKGDWRLRLNMILWLIFTLPIYIAIHIR